jgi:hypothetical protein
MCLQYQFPRSLIQYLYMVSETFSIEPNGMHALHNKFLKKNIGSNGCCHLADRNTNKYYSKEKEQNNSYNNSG